MSDPPPDWGGDTRATRERAHAAITASLVSTNAPPAGSTCLPNCLPRWSSGKAVKAAAARSEHVHVEHRSRRVAYRAYGRCR